MFVRLFAITIAVGAAALSPLPAKEPFQRGDVWKGTVKHKVTPGKQFTMPVKLKIIERAGEQFKAIYEVSQTRQRPEQTDSNRFPGKMGRGAHRSGFRRTDARRPPQPERHRRRAGERADQGVGEMVGERHRSVFRPHCQPARACRMGAGGGEAVGKARGGKATVRRLLSGWDHGRRPGGRTHRWENLSRARQVCAPRLSWGQAAKQHRRGSRFQDDGDIRDPQGLADPDP